MMCRRTTPITKEEILDSIMQVAAFANRENFYIDGLTIPLDQWELLGEPRSITTDYGTITISQWAEE